MTTIQTLTTAQIVALSTEAARAGDTTTVRDCRRALDGSLAARRRVLAIIRAAEAMED
jgi:hypothetical protein